MRAPGARTRWWILLALVALGGCRCATEPFAVLSARATGAADPEAAALALQDAELERWLESAVRSERGLRLPEAGPTPAAAPREGARLDLQLALVRISEDAEGIGSTLELGVTLRLRRLEEGITYHDALDVLLREPLREESAEVVARRVLPPAIAGLVTRAAHQLEATRKSSDALVRELKDPTSDVRDAALQTLVERRDPRAFHAAEAQLQSADPLVVRRSIGMLVELGDRRAVPTLITMAQEGDSGALQELLFALGALGGEEAQAYLFTLASGHDSELIRAIAKQALEEASRRRVPADGDSLAQ